jgi:hypothetical protein
MLYVHDTNINSNAVCSKSVNELEKNDFQYFDKDGFELNIAEQKFYSAMDFPIHHPILNHCCWQVPWITMKENPYGLFLDHAMTLMRCTYMHSAREQLESLKVTIPQAQQLLQIKPKWGYDFDLNAISDNGTVYEVLHIEYDSRNFDEFSESQTNFEQYVKRADWVSIAKDIWNKRDEWHHLKGFDQNHWKANYLLGWKQSEYLEKVS